MHKIANTKKTRAGPPLGTLAIFLCILWALSGAPKMVDNIKAQALISEDKLVSILMRGAGIRTSDDENSVFFISSLTSVFNTNGIAGDNSETAEAGLNNNYYSQASAPIGPVPLTMTTQPEEETLEGDEIDNETENPVEETTTSLDLPQTSPSPLPSALLSEIKNLEKAVEVTLTPPKGTQGIYVSNLTKYNVGSNDELTKVPALKKQNEGKASILIIHTHGSESYLPDEENYYLPTDVERTSDTNYNVIRLGDEMKNNLEALGLNVIHDRNIYDSPTYSGSYGRSLKAIQKHAEENPELQVVIDIHRDSIETASGEKYKTVSETEEGKAAQMMIVVGSDASGLIHPNWRKNLNFACFLSETISEKYQTLMRPVNLRKERFNQHATTGSIILEVGTAGNSLTEALLSVKLFSDTAGKVLAEMMT